jgi:arogenate dehydrogenase (NADP+)
MASSLHHFAQFSSPVGGSTGTAAEPTPSLLRPFSPDFCTFATARPIRPAAAAPKLPVATTAAEQEQEQHAGADEEPSTPTKETPEPAAALRVGIIGFGNFGQFIAKGIQRQGHAVLASSRSDYSAYCSAHGIRFFR